ncbi:hypothetical protein TCAL_15314 [Tigriopus californicus]|uniref:Chitin-binding type-2 domain-containing protein n=1 Tax=Tigriopus californicus TaxID=6832 RepID=A0A553PKX8_TIGCA|nr:uncharacterized protein LOC131890289 [Tigriopus californicus]TRY78340.1 hypothetical protein TCAL_15314 [Tigriopus californicus]
MTISKSLILMGLLVAVSASKLFHQTTDFDPADKREQLGLTNQYPADIEVKPGNSDWPPIQEPWRCLESNDTRAIASFNSVIRSTSGIPDDDPNCPIVTPDICVSADFFPVPCNCHAYVRCSQMDTDGPLMPCIYKCKPYDLIFSPNQAVCVNDSGPSSTICSDTPPPPLQ